MAVSSAVSIALGQDANWDLQNYHFYGPWAWLEGRAFGRDVAAAQLQTYLNPLLDLPFYAMVASDWNPRLISAVLALPAGISAWLLAKLAWALFGGIDTPSRLVAVVASLAIGLTAAMAVGTLGMTMNDWPGTALTLAALWLIVRAIVSGRGAAVAVRTLVAAGALIGAASGLKLTVATFAVAMCIGLLLRPPLAVARLREALVFGVAVLAGFSVTYAYWGWQLWTHFGNPVFPFANQWFGSPWWEQRPVYERVFGPHGLRAWLRFPFTLYSPQPGFVSEIQYADPRIPLTYALALIAVVSLAVQRVARIHVAEPAEQPAQVTQARTLVALFWAASFILWTAQHSILRYIVVLEITTGLLIVGMLRWMLRPAYANAVIVTVAAAMIVATQWPDWWRIDHGRRWFDVSVPAVESDALILMTLDAPMAYVLPFFPKDARHLGVRNNINSPNRKTLLQRSVEESIDNHRGPMYALSFPANQGEADLAGYGLRRIPATCADVKSAMRTSPIQLCRLERVGIAPR